MITDHMKPGDKIVFSVPGPRGVHTSIVDNVTRVFPDERAVETIMVHRVTFDQIMYVEIVKTNPGDGPELLSRVMR